MFQKEGQWQGPLPVAARPESALGQQQAARQTAQLTEQIPSNSEQVSRTVEGMAADTEKANLEVEASPWESTSEEGDQIVGSQILEIEGVGPIDEGLSEGIEAMEQVADVPQNIEESSRLDAGSASEGDVGGQDTAEERNGTLDIRHERMGRKDPQEPGDIPTISQAAAELSQITEEVDQDIESSPSDTNDWLEEDMLGGTGEIATTGDWEAVGFPQETVAIEDDDYLEDIEEGEQPVAKSIPKATGCPSRLAIILLGSVGLIVGVALIGFVLSGFSSKQETVQLGVSSTATTIPTPVPTLSLPTLTNTYVPTLLTSMITPTPEVVLTDVPPTSELTEVTPTETDTRIEGILIYDSNLRSGPGVEFEVIAYLLTGTRLVILGRDNPGVWLMVRMSDGQEGWVATSQIYLGDLDILSIPVAPTGG